MEITFEVPGQNFLRLNWCYSMCVIMLVSVNICSAYTLGIEAIPASLQQQYAAPGVRIGLVTNHTGKTQQGERSIDLLVRAGFAVRTIFAPEHGLDGEVRASSDIGDAVDAATGIPIVSLYGNGSGKRLTAATLADIDCIMFDMQDLGMRHYTYISTLYTVLQAAAQFNKKIIVFDRPNPLGDCLEGPICAPHLRSFIGICSIPLRHGMTMGELAQLFNTKMLATPADLEVVPMHNYTRVCRMRPMQTHFSPNVRSLESVYGYSFLGLLGEVRPFILGVGTTHAFQLIMLPASLGVSAQAWQELQSILYAHGVLSRPHSYVAARTHKEYQGLRLSIPKITRVPAFKLLLALLQWAKDNGVPITFSPVFDKAVGTEKVRAWFNGDITREELLATVHDDLQQFLQQHRDTFLYKGHPRIVYRQRALLTAAA